MYPSDWFGQHFDDEVHSLVDYIHVMAYDFSGPWSSPGPCVLPTGSVPGIFPPPGCHTGRSISRHHRPIQYPQAPDADQVANIYYNGVQTITDKTQFVVDNEYPGVMIWEISHDTPEAATSLLHAVDRIANP